MGNEVHENQKHHHNAADVGEAGMGEGKEMPEEDGGVNQQQQGKNYKVVGLQTDEQHNHQEHGLCDNHGSGL